MPKTPARRLRWFLLVLAILVLVPVVGVGVLLATFDPEHFKPRIEAALSRATGRDVLLNGPIRIRLTPALTLEASDASLANMADGTRPDMAVLQQVRAEVALWPLLHREVAISRVVLVHPDILLETDAAGRPNWRFRHRGPAALAAAAPRHFGSARLAVRSVRVEDGTLTWHDGRSGASDTFGLRRLEVSEASDEAPIMVAGDVLFRGTAVAVSGQLGSLARLRDAASSAPWPVRLSLAAEGAQATASGTFTNPRRGGGYALKIEGTAPDLAQLAPLVPEARLPPLRDVALTVELNDAGAGRPEPSALVLHAGASDLGTLMPGLKLIGLDISAPRFDQPVHADVKGSYADAPLRLTASLGAPISLVPGMANAPFPVDIDAQAAGAQFTAKGSIARPGRLSGLDVKLAARVPDLAALSPLVHRSLPPLKDIAFDAELADRNGSYADGLFLKGVKLTLPQGDVTGDIVLGFAPRPSLDATLSARRIDTDGVRSAFAQPPGLPAAPGVAVRAPPPLAGPPSPAPPRRPPSGPWLIPDSKLPLDALARADSDVRVTVGVLRNGGVEYHDVVAHLMLHRGHLRLDPLEGQLAEQPFDLHLDVNTAQPKLPITLQVHAPGIPLKTLLAALHLPDDDAGMLEVDADLSSNGATPHAIAAGLNGRLGLALVGGAVDNRLLAGTLDRVLHDAKLPAAIPGLDPGTGGSGHSDVRCFALRLDANHGVANIRALMLDMTRFRLSGGGSIDFSDEALALRLRPLLKLAGSGVAVPLRVNGTLLAPRAEPEPSAAAAGAAAKLGGRGRGLAAIAGALAGERGSRAADTGDCAPALALARNGAPGPMPPPPKAEKGLSTRDLLRGLLR